MAKRGFYDFPSAPSAICLGIAVFLIPVAAGDVGCCGGMGPIYGCSVFIGIPGLILMSLCFSVFEGELPAPTGPKGKCAVCGYSLDGLPTARCPECGHLNESSGGEAANDPSL